MTGTQTHVTFVRHGEHKIYADGMIKYPGPGLTKKGIMQAKKTAVYLKDFKFDRIYSSDMTRAEETANEIKKYQKCRISYHRELAEVNMVVFDKKPVDKEKAKLALERMNKTLKFFRKILRENKGKKILIVAHGNVIRGILGTSFGLKLTESPHFHMHNCALSTLIFENGKLKGIPQLCYVDHHDSKGFNERISIYHERIEFWKKLKNKLV